MPHFGASASRSGKSPDGAVRSICGKNLHGFHKDCFLDCKIEPPVYGSVRHRRLVDAFVRRVCVPAVGSAADFTRCREILHGAHKQNGF